MHLLITPPINFSYLNSSYYANFLSLANNHIKLCSYLTLCTEFPQLNTLFLRYHVLSLVRLSCSALSLALLNCVAFSFHSTLSKLSVSTHAQGAYIKLEKTSLLCSAFSLPAKKAVATAAAVWVFAMHVNRHTLSGCCIHVQFQHSPSSSLLLIHNKLKVSI